MPDLLTLRMAWRFTRSRRGGTLSHFMSMASAAGIAIGVAALIIGLSAMNGFERELEDRVLSIIPSGTLYSYNQSFKDPKSDLEILRSVPGIDDVSSGVMLDTVLKAGTSFTPIRLIGVSPKSKLAHSLSKFIDVPETFFEASEPKLIAGSAVAQKLKLKPGSRVSLLLNDDFSSAGASLEIAGFFHAGGQLDSILCFMGIDEATKAAGLMSPNVFMFKTGNLLQAPVITREAAKMLPERVRAESWVDTQGKLYTDIQMIRGIMYLAMILVMAVACFNIVSNLIVAVAEKKHEIAVLKTLGASRSRIVSIFVCSGVMFGLRGSIIGTVFGSVIALLLTPLMQSVENIFGFKFLNPDVYFVDFIPSSLNPYDIILVLITALTMSALASFYPAWKASKVDPARELNI